MKQRRAQITAKRLRDVIDYDRTTGLFTWKKTLGTRGSAGKIAGSRRIDGYMVIGVNGVTYMAHRLAWLHVHGEWPLAYIDHANGDPSDNRLVNLREASQSLNNANSKPRKGNYSGFKGVRLVRRIGKWDARICLNGKRVFLGYFDDPEAANSAYADAARNLFGKFARSS